MSSGSDLQSLILQLTFRSRFANQQIQLKLPLKLQLTMNFQGRDTKCCRLAWSAELANFREEALADKCPRTFMELVRRFATMMSWGPMKDATTLHVEGDKTFYKYKILFVGQPTPVAVFPMLSLEAAKEETGCTWLRIAYSGLGLSSSDFTDVAGFVRGEDFRLAQHAFTLKLALPPVPSPAAIMQRSPDYGGYQLPSGTRPALAPAPTTTASAPEDLDRPMLVREWHRVSHMRNKLDEELQQVAFARALLSRETENLFAVAESLRNETVQLGLPTTRVDQVTCELDKSLKAQGSVKVQTVSFGSPARIVTSPKPIESAKTLSFAPAATITNAVDDQDIICIDADDSASTVSTIVSTATITTE